MKKRIQKYLSGSNEGFSLVELIIVIAIMAILVGVVALAVIPNLERSRESKDLATLDSACSALSVAVANAGSNASSGSARISNGTLASMSNTMSTTFTEQLDPSTLKLSSSVASGKDIILEWDTTNGANKVKAYVDGKPGCKYAKDAQGNPATLESIGGNKNGGSPAPSPAGN